MLQFERMNRLSGVCLDEEIPITWVDNHVIVAQDLSLAVGLRVQYPDTLFVSSEQADELHNAFSSMLNQMAVMGDGEARLQFLTICHNQYDRLLDDYLLTMPQGNPLLAQFKRDLGQHYRDKASSNQLRRYSSYLFIGIEPIVEYSARIKRHRKLSPREHWAGRMSNFLRDTFELSMDGAAIMTEEEWNTAVNVLSKQVQQTQAILKAAGIQAALMPSDEILETLYWWYNPKSYALGTRPPPYDPVEPKPATSYFVQSQLEVNPRQGWIQMDGLYRRIVFLHEPPTQLQFGMLLPQMLAPGFVSGAFCLEARSSDTAKRLRKLKNRRLQVLGRVGKQPELRRTLEEIEAEIDELATGRDRPWVASHSIHLWATDLDILNNLVLEQRQFGQQNEGMTWIHETTPIFPYFLKTTPGYLSDKDRYRDHAYSSSQLATLLPALYLPDGSEAKAYTLLTAHILQKIGLSWSRCGHANLVPWYIPPKTRVAAGEERYGFQFIERLIRDQKPQLVISFGANIVPHLAKHLENATVAELQGQLIPLDHYQTQLICATQSGNLLSKAEWIKSWERTLRGALMNWFNQKKDSPPDPPCFRLDNPEDLRRHLQEIQDDREEVVCLDTEFFGHDITDYRILDIILATRSRTLNIRVHEGRHEPVLRNPYDLPDGKGAVYIFPNEAAFRQWTPPPHSFHAYIDDVRWVFQGSQKELTDILNQHLRRPEIKLVGHALKVDAIQLILFGVDLRDQLHLCTYDLAKVLDEGQPQGLEDLIKVYLGKEDHKAELARYRATRGITDGSYGLVPPEIRLPYGCKDGRRTFELVPAMLADLKQQDEDLKRREPDAYANGWTLENAYFNVKRKQMGALIEMELVGHPFSLKRLAENVEWYDTRLERLLAETVAYIKTRLTTPEVNPGSATQLRQILFNQPPEGIGLYPMYTTEKPVREWPRAVKEMLFKAAQEPRLKPGAKLEEADKKKGQALLDFIHQRRGSATFDLKDPGLRKLLSSTECPMPLKIPERDYPVLTASTNQETLEMLATADPLCEKLNDCRSIATLANNYCRKDGPWGASRVKEYLESLEEGDDADRDQLELFGAGEVEAKKAHDPKLVGKRQKAMSMAVNRDQAILYTTYWGSLETHRLTGITASWVPLSVNGGGIQALELRGKQTSVVAHHLQHPCDLAAPKAMAAFPLRPGF